MKKTKPKKIQKIYNIRTLVNNIKNDDSGWFEYQGKAIYIGFRHGKDKEGMTRKQRLYYERREKGLCVVCAKPVKKTNLRTGAAYRLCEVHRRQIDMIPSSNI